MRFAFVVAAFIFLLSGLSLWFVPNRARSTAQVPPGLVQVAFSRPLASGGVSSQLVIEENDGGSPEPLESSLDFQTDIKPILSDRCFKCHGPDEANREADLRLDTREGAFKELGGAYAIIKPGDLEASELYFRMTTDDPDLVMPPPDSNLTVTDEEKRKLSEWIKQGAEWDEHWFFQPLKPLENTGDSANESIEVPDDWNETAIDRFVYRRMTENGLAPSQPAERFRLIRRVSFDLTGLPPTPQEVATFLADDSEDAYVKLVDRLLESDAYAERMTSDWLDVARYSDSYGYQVDRPRFVWPWRDWVLNSFKNNQSYADFLTEQIAGDLLPNATPEQILATTFCRLHPQKVEGGSVPEEFRNEYVADRMQTVSTAFLGLTLECARCHDHKYDPISQKEYYSLYAFFNNIDEAGLYSYFTNSIPTPTLLLPNEQQQQQLTAAEQAIESQQRKLDGVSKEAEQRFEEWFAEYQQGSTPLEKMSPIKSLDFEEIANAPNLTVKGVVGNGLQMTGDDGVGVGVGDFGRNQPFSISWWMRTPDRKSRAVIFHRSRAWTDAASRGYELLLEEGKLKWSLIHFWPGNAISIRSKSELPIDEWQQVVVTYDGSSQASGLAIWVNGELAETEVIKDNLFKQIKGGGNENITLGERFRDRGFKGGAIDEFKCFDRALSQLEIKALAKQEEVQAYYVREIAEQAAASSAGENNRTKTIESSLESSGDSIKTLLQSHFVEVLDEPYKKELAELSRLMLARNQLQDKLSEIMVMAELPERRTTYLLNRGAYDSPGDEVEPTTLAALPAFPEDLPSNRLGLARWLTDDAAPQTSRVAVNHYWQMLFGQGLVRTPEDFGSQGKPPTHPLLLDWLANDFVENNWDVKRLLRQMVLSQTYQQDSLASKEAVEVDPENLWLARMSRYRWPAEMVRDNQLAVSERLVQKWGGPSAKPLELAQSFKPMAADQGEGRYRRSVYTYWQRTAPAPVMMALDASKRDVCVVKRERTQTPLQSLVLLNDPLAMDCSIHLAQQMVALSVPDQERIVQLFVRLTSRKPDEREQQVIANMLEQQGAHFAVNLEQAKALLGSHAEAVGSEAEVVDQAAWALVISTLMNLDECVTKY